MKTTAAVHTCLALALWCNPALARGQSAKPRLSWDLSAGPMLSDNAYRDSTNHSDWGHLVSGSVAAKSRIDAKTSAELRYGVDVLAFREANVENQTDHVFEGLVRRRLSRDWTAEARAGLRMSRFPNVDVFNHRTLFAEAKARFTGLDRTTLQGGASYERRSYADYDLDYHGLGVFGSAGRELSVRTYLELEAALQPYDHAERRLWAVTSGEAEVRKDRERTLGVRLSHDVTRTLDFEAGYRYRELDSNGDFLDPGPFQTEFDNPFPGDDRVVPDYYSYRSHGPIANVRKLIRKGTSLLLTARYEDRSYSGRLAKDESDLFRTPEEKRKDRYLRLKASYDMPFPFLPKGVSGFGLRLGYTFELNSSNESLYDYNSSAFSVAVTSWR